MRHNRLVIIAAIIITLFTACSGSPGVIVPDFAAYSGIIPDGKEITVMQGIHTGSLPVFQELIEKFNNENKYGIKVRLATSDILTAAETDLAIVNPSSAARLLKTGASVELSPLIYHPVWGFESGRSDFFKAARQQTDYWDFSKRITSIPLLMDAGIMIVNKEILNETGFRRFPKSWVGMTALLRRSGRSLQKPVGIQLDTESLVSLIQSRGGSILRPVGFDYSINNPAVNRSLRYLRRYEKKGFVSVNRVKYGNQTDFAFGKLLAVYTGVDGITAYQKLIEMVSPELDWGIELLPTRKPGDGVAVNCIYSAALMNGDAEKQCASWIFIKWLTEPEQQCRLSRETGSIPATSESLEAIISNVDNGFSSKWLEAAELIVDSNMEQLPSLYDYDSVSEQFSMMVERIFEGKWVWLETTKLDRKVKKDRRAESEKRRALNEK